MNAPRSIRILLATTLVLSAGLCRLCLAQVAGADTFDPGPVCDACAAHVDDPAASCLSGPRVGRHVELPNVLQQVVPTCCDEGEDDTCLNCGASNGTVAARAVEIPRFRPDFCGGLLNCGVADSSNDRSSFYSSVVRRTLRAGPVPFSLFAQRCLLLV